jgi:hypothetical protein
VSSRWARGKSGILAEQYQMVRRKKSRNKTSRRVTAGHTCDPYDSATTCDQCERDAKDSYKVNAIGGGSIAGSSDQGATVVPEFLGVSMSEVRVDDAALSAEADAIASEFAGVIDPAVPTAPGEQPPSEADVLAGYRMISFAVADRGFEIIAPAWAVTTEEKTRLADAMAQALVLWFPDQPIPPKYLALLVLAGVGLEIVAARKDPVTGQLKPRTHAKPEPKASAANTEAA